MTGFQVEKAQVVHKSSESYREEIKKGCEDITKSAKLDPPKPTPKMWTEASSLHPQMLLGRSTAVTHNQQWQGERNGKSLKPSGREYISMREKIKKLI